MLKLEHIEKSYRDGERRLPVLAGLNLELKSGQSLALMGQSGSGKSTLLKIAAGLMPPDSGSVTIAGQKIAAFNDTELSRLRRQKLGFVFQQYNLLPGLSAADNIRFPRRLNGLPEQDDWLDSIVTTLELSDLLGNAVETLSGGEQQRVAIARALAHRPRLLFADEPTGNLHESLSHKVMKMLQQLTHESHCALLLVTHARSMAAYLDRQATLKAGVIQESHA